MPSEVNEVARSMSMPIQVLVAPVSACCTSAIWSKNGFDDITSAVLAKIAALARGDVSFQVSNAFAMARTASSLGGML